MAAGVNGVPDGPEIGPLAAWMLPALGRIAQTAPDPWREDDLRPCLQGENHPCFVALWQGRPAGFACFLAVADTADLQLIVVDPALRGRGLGRALLSESLTALQGRGLQRVLLEVRCGNQSALGLYQSFGFKTLARRPGMYRNPAEDGFLLQWTVES